MARAALAAGIGSGLPSTIHAVATGRDVLEATRAAGTLLRPGPWQDLRQAAAGVLAHAVLSAGWAGVLTSALRRRRRPVSAGAVCGAAIALLDLSIAARWYPRIAALPTAPQVADHIAFGALVGAVVAANRRRPTGRSSRLIDRLVRALG